MNPSQVRGWCDDAAARATRLARLCGAFVPASELERQLRQAPDALDRYADELERDALAFVDDLRAVLDTRVRAVLAADARRLRERLAEVEADQERLGAPRDPAWHPGRAEVTAERQARRSERTRAITAAYRAVDDVVKAAG